MTKLSLIIAARNEERYLPEQLLAIQTQSVQPDEIVLVDDGSTDATSQIMAAFARYCPNVRIIGYEQSVGATAAYNRGIAESRGEWLFLPSANDPVQSGALRAIAHAISLFPNAPLVVGDLAGLPLGWSDSTAPVWIEPARLAGMLGHRGIIHGGAVAVARWAWESVGGRQADVGAYDDALMWHVLGCRHGIAYTPHPITAVRPNEPGQGNGAITLDYERRGPYLEALTHHILALEEPTRTRLIESDLWSIREFAPDMAALLTRAQRAVPT